MSIVNKSIPFIYYEKTLDDMDRLNGLYEELEWDHTDYLEFKIEGNHITIRNRSREGR